MPFYIPMIESEDILEKDNGGIQEITERERAVSCFTVVVERDEAAAACEDEGEESAACEDGDEDETCTGEARRMSELRVSGECFTVVVERDEVAAACEDGGEEAAACEDGDEDETLSIGKDISLVYSGIVDLSQNSLTEEIPSEIPGLKSLESLNLSNINLSGLIPKVFEDMNWLEHVDISFNELEGPIPISKAFTNASVEGLQGNKGLCGNVTGLQPCKNHFHTS
ncbi:hypothetical protein RHGRI_010095 [Rhododendron griersonianum]|uniref:non-specific serine/threonine protein kinase n=1 Tax=Rhododendron griersonianum TaxID=479676 RepID=A0AAV6KH56_9ERIC|nr:hypothetical protein RHGRI_010095 [Rhododendron griersonianum]